MREAPGVLKHSGVFTPKEFMSWILLLPGIAALLAGLSLTTDKQVQLAESLHPPVGQFITIENTTLHYLVSGEGEDLILIHGSGSTSNRSQVLGWIHFRNIFV